VKSKISLFFIITLAGIFGLSGCTLADRPTAEERHPRVKVGVMPGKGDAFLYDIMAERNGKKNSARLDVYRQGDSLGLFARGYLGKGVLKGLIIPNSITIYFPTENEFYRGSIADLLKSNCPDSAIFEKYLIELFAKIPSEIEHSFSDFYLTILKETGHSRDYRLESKNCEESIELKYELREGRFVLEKLDYQTPDNSFRFRATRRQHRLNIVLPADKFSVPIPESATRI